MNIEDALLTQQILHCLTGSQGKTHAQLASECRVSQRRMTHHLFCLEKAALIVTHANARVTLADALAALVWRHADKLEFAHEAKKGPAYSQQWVILMAAQRLHSSAVDEQTRKLFGEFFGRTPF